MRRTSGSPARPTSIGIAMPVSSSSAPMAGFWTMTLKTGAERSGNTSRGRAINHVDPIAVPAATRSTARSGRAKVARMTRPTSAGSVLMVPTLAARLLGLGLQEEGALDHDGLPGREPLDDLHFPCEIPPSPDRAWLERPLVARDEDGPGVVEPLDGCGRYRDHQCPAFTDREPGVRRHAGPEETVLVLEIDPDGDRARARIDAAADECHGPCERPARERGQRDARPGTWRDPHGIALEGVDRQPQPREVGDAKERVRRFHHPAARNVPVDADAPQ